MPRGSTRCSVQRLSLPRHSLAAVLYARHGFSDHTDTFGVWLPPGTPSDQDSMMRGVADATPRWARLALQLRDLLVGPLGLETCGRDRERGVLAQLPTYGRLPDELVVGLDDRHLDFRASLRAREQDGGVMLTVTTLVRLHGWPGRAYFALVRPFHALIVPALVRGVAEWLVEAGTSAAKPPAGRRVASPRIALGTQTAAGTRRP